MIYNIIHLQFYKNPTASTVTVQQFEMDWKIFLVQLETWNSIFNNVIIYSWNQLKENIIWLNINIFKTQPKFEHFLLSEILIKICGCLTISLSNTSLYQTKVTVSYRWYWMLQNATNQTFLSLFITEIWQILYDDMLYEKYLFKWVTFGNVLLCIVAASWLNSVIGL